MRVRALLGHLPGAVLDCVDAHEHDQVVIARCDRGLHSDGLDLDSGEGDRAAALPFDLLAQRRALRSRTRDQHREGRERRDDLRDHG